MIYKFKYIQEKWRELKNKYNLIKLISSVTQ